ncbi:hypothetical protein, partial [Paenibacillus polysaccharolyticus]|uniref:hypothetical protein n=1 Tax=Paenibacillus polysaccharolyticus TaxID=582692 RepID=UPI00280A74CF
GNNTKWLGKKAISGKDAAFSWLGNNTKWLGKKAISGKDAAFSWLGNNAEWLGKKAVSGKDAAFSWLGNNARWLGKKAVSGKDAAFSWLGNNAKWLGKKAISGKDAAFSWLGNNAEWLGKKAVSGKDAAFSWLGNNAEWLGKKAVSGKDAAFSWLGNNAKWLGKKAISGKDATFSWLGSKRGQLKEWYKNIDFKKKFNDFFEVTTILNYIKDLGEKFIEFGKKKGWGIHSKIEDMWSNPLVKKMRMFGKRAFSFLDIGSSINDVVQAKTPDEKIIAFSKALLGKLGSISGGIAGTFAGSFIPAQPATVPALAYFGSLFGDFGGKFLGGLVGQGLTKIWPKSWWPYKKEKTSKINPTRNLNLNKGKNQNLISSINGTSPLQNVNVTLPTGAIQISNSSNKLDYDGLVTQISAHFVKELRKAMQNRKTIMA